MFLRADSVWIYEVENRICTKVRRFAGEQLFFAVDEIGSVQRRKFKTVTVRDGVRGAGLNTIAAEDAAVVIDVVDLGVTLGPAYSVLRSVFGGLDVDAIRRAGRRAQEARNALLQPVLVTLQYV